MKNKKVFLKMVLLSNFDKLLSAIPDLSLIEKNYYANKILRQKKEGRKLWFTKSFRWNGELEVTKELDLLPAKTPTYLVIEQKVDTSVINKLYFRDHVLTFDDYNNLHTATQALPGLTVPEFVKFLAKHIIVQNLVTYYFSADYPVDSTDVANILKLMPNSFKFEMKFSQELYMHAYINSTQNKKKRAREATAVFSNLYGFPQVLSIQKAKVEAIKEDQLLAKCWNIMSPERGAIGRYFSLQKMKEVGLDTLFTYFTATAYKQKQKHLLYFDLSDPE